MGSRVTVVRVELDETVSDIINNELLVLTEPMRSQLNTAIQANLMVNQVRDQRIQEKRSQDEAISSSLAEAERRLLAAGAEGVDSEAIMSLVQPVITTASAFTLRMKSRLKADGKLFVLSRKKNRYYLEPYNAELPSADAPPS